MIALLWGGREAGMGGGPAPMLQGQQGQRALEHMLWEGQAALALLLALVQKWGLCRLGDC